MKKALFTIVLLAILFPIPALADGPHLYFGKGGVMVVGPNGDPPTEQELNAAEYLIGQCRKFAYEQKVPRIDEGRYSYVVDQCLGMMQGLGFDGAQKSDTHLEPWHETYEQAVGICSEYAEQRGQLAAVSAAEMVAISDMSKSKARAFVTYQRLIMTAIAHSQCMATEEK